jgi:hypothetical protein
VVLAVEVGTAKHDAAAVAAPHARASTLVHLIGDVTLAKVDENKTPELAPAFDRLLNEQRHASPPSRADAAPER